MERIFTIVDTESQRTKEIKSTATTVAELKRDLRAQGFTIEGKTIQEALTRTEFKDDSSLLPHDVPYKGNITNNLVFRLTKTDKQIKSGISRSDLYAKIKQYNLQDTIKNKFGRNFTQITTTELEKIVEKFERDTKNKEKEIPTKESSKIEEVTIETKEEMPSDISAPNSTCKDCKIYSMLLNLCKALVNSGYLEVNIASEILGIEIKKDSNTPKYSQEELNSLLGGL